MKIITDLPFEQCENCPEFILKVNEQVLHSDNNVATRQITVTCKHDWLCRQLVNSRRESKIDVR